MNVPHELRYTKNHEWARAEADGTVTVGITWHAQDRLGDLVYVSPPQIGKTFDNGQQCGVVESVKTASDIYSPVAGEVVAVNVELESNPERINEDPYTAWIFKLRPSNPDEFNDLLNAAEYESLASEEET
jgi:glycine cleavage system H protein